MKDHSELMIPTYDDMLAAHDRIRPHIRLTPVRTSDYLNELAGCQLFFKCENFQEPGAFKVRGAANAVFGLTDEQAARGVATTATLDAAQSRATEAAQAVARAEASRALTASSRSCGFNLFQKPSSSSAL